MTRRAARRKVARTAGVPLYAAEFRPVRGKCRAPMPRGRTCPSRWGIVRVSIDLTSRAAVDKLATLECADCGATWRRVRVPPTIADPHGYQTCRLTLILPAEQRVYYNRSSRKRTTADGSVALTNATITDYMAASDDWRGRNAQLIASRERAAARKAEADREAVARMAALLDAIHAREEAAAEEEAAAVAREA